MGDWLAYKGAAGGHHAVNDQSTLNAVIISSRLGIQVAPITLSDLMDWKLLEDVRVIPPPNTPISNPRRNPYKIRFGNFHAKIYICSGFAEIWRIGRKPAHIRTFPLA